MGAKGTGFHGAEWYGEAVGDLRVRELPEMLQADEFPVRVRKRRDGTTNLPDVIDLFGRGRGHRDCAIQSVDVVEVAVIPLPTVATVDVDGRPTGDARQPGPEAALRVEAGRVLPGLDESLLARVLGEADITQHPVSHRVHQPSENPIRLGDAVGLPRGESQRQPCLI